MLASKGHRDKRVRQRSGIRGIGLTSGRSNLSMSAAWLSNIIASTVASLECSFQYAFCASLSAG